MKILASMLKGLFEKWLRPQWIAGVRLKNSDIQEPAGSPYKLPKVILHRGISFGSIFREQQTSVSFEAAGGTASMMPSRCWNSIRRSIRHNGLTACLWNMPSWINASVKSYYLPSGEAMSLTVCDGAL